MKCAKITHHCRRGVLLTEACVSLVLVGLVLSMVSLLLTQHARMTDYYLNYRRVQLAAESCVERMRAGAVPVADAQFTDETGVNFEIHVADAPEAWRPLSMVSTVATVTGKNGREARYQLQTYMIAANTKKEGSQ